MRGVLDGQGLGEAGEAQAAADEGTGRADPRHRRVELRAGEEGGEPQDHEERSRAGGRAKAERYHETCGHARRHRPEEHHRGHHRSRRRRGTAARPLHEEGHEGVDAVDRRAQENAAQVGGGGLDPGEEREGNEGMRARGLKARESDERTRAPHDEGEAQPRGKGEAARAVQHREEESGDPDPQGQSPRQIERVAAGRSRLAQVLGHERVGEEARGKVDREDGPPPEGHGHPRAEEGPQEARRPPERAEEALHSGALAHRVEVGGHRQGGGEKAPRTQALKAAGEDELGHGARQGAGQGTGQEEDDGDEEDPAAAVEVGQAPIEGHGDRGGEEIDREDPRVERQPLQLADDRGHGGRHHRRLERREDRDQAQGHEHRASLLRVEARGFFGRDAHRASTHGCFKRLRCARVAFGRGSSVHVVAAPAGPGAAKRKPNQSRASA